MIVSTSVILEIKDLENILRKKLSISNAMALKKVIKVPGGSGLRFEFEKNTTENTNVDSHHKTADKEVFLNTRIYDLGLSVRVNNHLHHAKIETPRDLLSLTTHDLLIKKGFGEKCLQEVVNLLKPYNLSLKEEE